MAALDHKARHVAHDQFAGRCQQRERTAEVGIDVEDALGRYGARPALSAAMNSITGWASAVGTSTLTWSPPFIWALPRHRRA